MSIYLQVGTPTAADSPTIDQKLEVLRSILRDLGSVVIGFSGGADSALLARLAREQLGDRAIAVIALSESYPRREQEDAVAFASTIGIELMMVDTTELTDESYASNPTNRCYYCKKELFTHLARVARSRGIRWLAYGANHDDLADYRPGAVAADEFGVRAPLIEAGLTKPEIRHISRTLGLSTWDKPAMACLSSRFPYGTRITAKGLRMVEDAEDFLRRDLGFRQVRVRHHDTIARLEVAADEMDRLLEEPVRAAIHCRLKEIGYQFVALELSPYRSGSLNTHIETPLAVD